MKFSMCLLLLVMMWQATAQAPGDEDQRCLNERATANDVYPPFTRMLMGSRNYEELISGSRPHWQQLDVDGTGFGWTSTLGGLCAYEARVCDFREGTSQDNWVFTQYISYLQAREVFVNISAGFTECRLAQSPRCNQLYVDMYRYERNGRNDVAARTTSNYQLIQRIQQPNEWAQRTYQTYLTFIPSGNFNGMYIGVRATGTCVNVQRIQVYYRSFVRACRAGMYYSRSNPADSCLPCPANTIRSGLAVTACLCIRGYYRTAHEGPNVGCTRPPTAVRNLRVISKTNTSITIQWDSPNITGRSDYYYNVEHSDPNDILRYIQHNQERINGTNTTVYSVTGLHPFTIYIIRISVHNGVSGNDSQNDDERRRQVIDTTLEGIPSAPSSVQGLCTVVVWGQPSRTNGQLTGYDLRFYTTVYENILSNGSNKNFQIVKENDLPWDQRDNTFVQVRGRTRTGAGNWSEGVPLGCSELTISTTTPGEALTCPPMATCPPTPSPVTCQPVVTCPSVVEYPSVPCPTQLPASPPPPPAQVACVNVFYDEDKKVKLVIWDKPVEEVTVYSVRISYNDGSSGQRMNQHRSSKNQWIELHLKSLPMERPLWVEVRARNSGGTAPWSSRVELCSDENEAN